MSDSNLLPEFESEPANQAGNRSAPANGVTDAADAAAAVADPAEITFVRKVASAVPDILYVYDVQAGRNVYCNREIASVLGYSPQEVFDFGTDLFTRLLHPDDFEAIAEGHRKLSAADDGTTVEVAYRMCHKDGEWHWLRSRDTVFARDSDGNVVQKIGVAHDVTSELQAKEELTEAVDRYRSLVSVLTDFIWETDANSILRYVSPQATEMLGYSCEELLGRSVFDFMPPHDAEKVKGVLGQATAEEQFRALQHVAIASDGHAVHLEVRGTPMFAAGTGALLGYRGVSRDITNQHRLEVERQALEVEREALFVQTRQRADKDPLTGLLNRSAFDRAMNRLLPPVREGETGSAETDTKRSVAILLLDLDNLKFFNDTYGHAAGDDVIVFVADALRSCCGSDDIIARRGGDEYAVLLPGVDRAGADARLSSIKNAVSRTGYTPPQRSGSTADAVPITLSVSGGVSVMPQDGTTASTVFEAADERLYIDKTNAQIIWSESFKTDLSRNLTGFASLDTLVTSVAVKDRYTLRHSEDTLIYAVLIAEGLGLPEAEIHALKVAALLHDVGKIGVNDRLLRLPGPLTADEYETIKLHAALGASLVESAAPEIARQMPTVIRAIRHHHERWDGGEGGYPDRLAGEAIPFHARILAVADALSAMTTDRPYRKGLAVSEAINRLRAGAGTQWDSRCVDALITATENVGH